MLIPYHTLTHSSAGRGIFVEVLEEKLHVILRSMVDLVEVDEQWYRQRYRDIDDAIIRGSLESAKIHYVASGYFENRIPRQITVDAKWYLETYTDVGLAVKTGHEIGAQEHFERLGMREGRLPFPGWTL